MDINRHVFFLQAGKLEGHADVIRVLVAMHVYPVCNRELVVSYAVVVEIAYFGLKVSEVFCTRGKACAWKASSKKRSSAEMPLKASLKR